MFVIIIICEYLFVIQLDFKREYFLNIFYRGGNNKNEVIKMEIPYEVANLRANEIEKIKALEKELNTILIAYDMEKGKSAELDKS